MIFSERTFCYDFPEKRGLAIRSQMSLPTLTKVMFISSINIMLADHHAHWHQKFLQHYLKKSKIASINSHACCLLPAGLIIHHGTWFLIMSVKSLSKLKASVRLFDGRWFSGSLGIGVDYMLWYITEFCDLKTVDYQYKMSTIAIWLLLLFNNKKF